MSAPPGFQIGFVSLQTGLSTHVIRAWERRYKAVEPHRSASGRRLFTEADIDRLVLLKQAVARGHSISTIAGRDRETLAALAGFSAESGEAKPAATAHPHAVSSRDTIAACLEAIARLDGYTVHRKLNQAAVTANRQALLENVIVPLMEAVGQQWSQGSGRIVYGHFAAGIVHAQLVGMLAQQAGGRPEKPRLLIATPTGQCCYLGALAVALFAQDHGWQPIFIGSDLPAEEIAAAHALAAPQMIALSITCRVNDDFMQAELRRLFDFLAGQCPIVIGGRASDAYRPGGEDRTGAIWATTQDFINQLH